MACQSTQKEEQQFDMIKSEECYESKKFTNNCLVEIDDLQYMHSMLVGHLVHLRILN